MVLYWVWVMCINELAFWDFFGEKFVYGGVRANCGIEFILPFCTVKSCMQFKRHLIFQSSILLLWRTNTSDLIFWRSLKRAILLLLKLNGLPVTHCSPRKGLVAAASNALSLSISSHTTGRRHKFVFRQDDKRRLLLLILQYFKKR